MAIISIHDPYVVTDIIMVYAVISLVSQVKDGTCLRLYIN